MKLKKMFKNFGLEKIQLGPMDWEIGSNLRKTKKNSRCGLLGILLPDHPASGKEEYDPRLIPP